MPPGTWKSFDPFPGWPPEQGRRIWFEWTLHNLDHDWILHLHYDLESSACESRLLPDGAEGWGFQPVRMSEGPTRPPTEPQPVPTPPIAVCVGNPAEEEFRILGFPDLETAHEYVRRRHRASVESSLRPRWLDSDDTPVDAHGRVLLPLEELRQRASYGGEWSMVEGNKKGCEISNSEFECFVANPPSPEEVDYLAMEKALGLVEWTIDSPVGRPALHRELKANPELRAWFCSAYWMNLVKDGLRKAFFLGEHVLVSPGPWASESGDKVYYPLRDPTEQEDFFGLVTMVIPVDTNLNPTGAAEPCIFPEGVPSTS
ncbi:MAG: hypothetical protein H7834_16585 [Magnetococcus sp. YQC-9]